MYSSQPKTNSFRLDSNSYYLNKQNIIPSTKLNIYPPKIHRVSSISSNLYLNETLHKSFSKQIKPYKDLSKSKDDVLQQKNNINNSFNTNYDINKFTKDFTPYRYSCNIDTDKNSDYNKSTGQLGTSYDRKSGDTELENRIKSLQQKMKKNEQNIKFYCQQIQHFKHQFSSSNLLDSVNTNFLSGSIKQPLKQAVNILNVTNKQNMNKNINVIDSVALSPKQNQLQKKLKQIEQIKKQIKKMKSKDEIIKGDMKMMSLNVKQILSQFKQETSRSYLYLKNLFQKNKNKVFDQMRQELDKRLKQLQNNQPINKIIQNDKQNNNNNLNKITKSEQKFIKDPILIKIKQQVFGLIKKINNVSPFQSYQDMIKRNIYQSIGKSSSFSNFHNNTLANKQNFTNHTLSNKQNFTNNNAFAKQNFQNNNTVVKQKNNDQNFKKITLQQIQTTYYIDEQGYLLDSSGYYLLKEETKIKLETIQLDKLKQNKILQDISSIYTK